MAFTGGVEVSARDLRDIYPLTGVTEADVAVNQTIDWEVVPGLTVICAPSTAYALDGYIAWDAGVTPGIRVGLTIPPSAIGRWGMQRVGPGVTTGSGVLQSGSTTSFGTGGTTGGSSAAGGAGYGLMRAYLQTGTDAGSVQVTFTQNVADAAFISIKAGSWLTLTKMGTV